MQNKRLKGWESDGICVNFFVYVAPKFGSMEICSYLRSVKGGTKQSHDVRNGGMAAETRR